MCRNTKDCTFLKKLKPKLSFCIVGEPTGMNLVNEHKGKKNFSIEFKGIEAHSSLVENGVNAISYGVEFIKFLENLQTEIKAISTNNKFNPPYSTINVGTMEGGIALNIIPKFCKIEFEIRDIPGINTNDLIKRITEFSKLLELKMKKQNKKCSISLKKYK